jgi:hypothetical protein
MKDDDVPLLFRDPREVEARRRFTLDCEISIENFVKLIGKTAFKPDDWVYCQIRKPNGHRCGTKFGDGWVALNADGDEGYIGGDCADRDFDASQTYKVERSRMKAHFDVRDLVTVLENQLRDRPAFEHRLQDVLQRAERSYSQAESLRSALPRKIVDSLMQRHKVSNVSLNVLYKYVEEEKEKQKDGSQKVKVIASWVPQTIARIAGLQAIHFATTLTPKVNAERIAKCLDEVRIEASAGKENLQRWSETLGTLGQVTSAIEAAEAALRNFTKLENLQALLLLTENPAMRDEMALFILRRQGNREATTDDARRMVDAFDQGVRDRNRGRDFRIR